jgi:hypothetical protein
MAGAASLQSCPQRMDRMVCSAPTGEAAAIRIAVKVTEIDRVLSEVTARFAVPFADGTGQFFTQCASRQKNHSD